jgi:hypothetical protein
MKRNNIARLRAKSGNIKSKDKLVCFLYILMRDYIPCGKVEEIMYEQISDEESVFTNGYLAKYAQDIAERLK